MIKSIENLERAVNSGLTTSIKKSEIIFEQLYIEINIENLISTILFLKTSEMCKFKQLIDITAVDYPGREKRFKIVYLLLSLENNFRILISSYIDEKNTIPSITKILVGLHALVFFSLKWVLKQYSGILIVFPFFKSFI